MARDQGLSLAIWPKQAEKDIAQSCLPSAVECREENQRRGRKIIGVRVENGRRRGRGTKAEQEVL